MHHFDLASKVKLFGQSPLPPSTEHIPEFPSQPSRHILVYTTFSFRTLGRAVPGVLSVSICYCSFYFLFSLFCKIGMRGCPVNHSCWRTEKTCRQLFILLNESINADIHFDAKRSVLRSLSWCILFAGILRNLPNLVVCKYFVTLISGAVLRNIVVSATLHKIDNHPLMQQAPVLHLVRTASLRQILTTPLYNTQEVCEQRLGIKATSLDDGRTHLR